MAVGKKMRALVADDETHVRFYLNSVLSSMKIEVAGEATNGQEAVDMYRKIRPHFLLLDINMPVKNGDQALSEIRSEFPEALVIVLTATVTREIVEKFIDLGAANFIRKDTPVPEIKKIIKQTWDEYRQSKVKKNGG